MTIYNGVGIKYNAHIAYNGTPSVVTALDLPSYILRATDKAGVVSLLPKAVISNMSFEYNSPGAINLSVTEGTQGYAQVAEYTKIELLMNGVVVRDGTWLLRKSDYNEGVKTKVKAFQGVNYLWDRLAHTVVNANYVHKYTLKAPGAILSDLFTVAKLRGSLEGLSWNFSATKDSFGNAWPYQVSFEYKASVKYSDVVNSMIEANLIDIWQQGNEIMVGVTNRYVPASPALLVVGKDVTDAPQQTSAESVAGYVVAVDENDKVTIVSNPDIQTKFGYREEVGMSVGGTGTPRYQADATLFMGNDLRTQRTYDVVMNPGRRWFPLRDYFIGQRVRVEHGNNNVMNLVIKQITMQVKGNGLMTAGIVLNDKFLEFDMKLAQALAGITMGTTITGSSRTSTPADAKDQTIPAAVTGLVLGTNNYQNTQGVTKAWVQAVWNPVAINTDSTLIEDLANYYLVWWYTDQTFASRKVITIDNTITDWMWDNLDPRREISVYVYTKDTAGHQGSWSGIETITTSMDTIAPTQPSVPTGRALLKQLIVTWNGKDINGDPPPPDFKNCRVYTQLASPFDPTNTVDGIMQGVLTGPGDLVIMGYAIGDVVTYRLVAEDLSGNLSTPSASGTNTIYGVDGVDMNFDTITANNLQSGSVTTPKVAAGAITTDKITLGQTLNLVQDPGFGDAKWRARRLTKEFAEFPIYWFFKNNSGIARSGYYLQLLSTPAGVNGGKMMITDWINVQMGETWYVRATVREGEFTPNAEGRFHLGIEVEKRDGTIVTDYLEYDPFNTWNRVEYQLSAVADWAKVRYWIRGWNLNSGDIAVDDLEVKGQVGTTALSGARMQITPLGLRTWDFLDNPTVILDAQTGDFTAKGTIKSGFTGKRTEVNPGATYLPEIRFYPATGNNFAYINASDNGTFPFIGVNAPDIGVTSNAMVLYDASWTIGEITKANGTVGGPGIWGEAGATGRLILTGMMPNAAIDGKTLFSGWRFDQVANTMTVTKPVAPSAGIFTPVLTPARQTGDTNTANMAWWIASNFNASYQVICPTIVPVPKFTELMFRAS